MVASRRTDLEQSWKSITSLPTKLLVQPKTCQKEETAPQSFSVTRRMSNQRIRLWVQETLKIQWMKNCWPRPSTLRITEKHSRKSLQRNRQRIRKVWLLHRYLHLWGIMSNLQSPPGSHHQWDHLNQPTTDHPSFRIWTIWKMLAMPSLDPPPTISPSFTSCLEIVHKFKSDQNQRTEQLPPPKSEFSDLKAIKLSFPKTDRKMVKNPLPQPDPTQWEISYWATPKAKTSDQNSNLKFEERALTSLKALVEILN